MASIILYRADKREFKQGQEIQSANQFQELNPRGSDKVERIFEAKRPDTKPSRLDALYLFEDFVVAKKHWSKMKDGKLYEVRVEDSEVRHRGDMRLVDEAFGCSDLADIEACADRYWAGEMTASPIMELLVQSAAVSAVLSKDQAERRRYLLNWPPT